MKQVIKIGQSVDARANGEKVEDDKDGQQLVLTKAMTTSDCRKWLLVECHSSMTRRIILFLFFFQALPNSNEAFALPLHAEGARDLGLSVYGHTLRFHLCADIIPCGWQLGVDYTTKKTLF